MQQTTRRNGIAALAIAAIASVTGPVSPAAAHPPIAARPALHAAAPTIVRSSTGPQVMLRWTPPKDAHGFCIYRNQIPIAVGVAGPQYQDRALEYGRSYTYLIATTLPNGQRITSAPYRVTVSATPKPRRVAAMARR